MRLTKWCTVAITLVTGALCILVAGPASAQQAQPTFEEVIARAWKAEHDKILDMAKDFPVELYDARPHVDSRSFLDEMRHVTIGLEMSTAQLRGEAFDYPAREAADESKPPTRESVVGEMEDAIAASYALVDEGTSPALPRLVFWIGHQSEHYGKLVSIYRMNGLVPPVSRGRP